MDYLLIGIAALLGSALTLFSGFGLGTILLPVFGLFFPIEIAITITAMVHFLNNVLKFIVFGKNANRNIILRFGIPAIVFSFIGAFVLKKLTVLAPLFTYTFRNTTFAVEPIKIVIGLLLIAFALLDVVPKLKKLEIDQKYLSLGGILSGFFGGLSGHQGALRSAFLIRTGLTKEVFVATGVVIACGIDVARLSIYIPKIVENHDQLHYKLIGFATLSAFLGVYLGNKLLQKITITTIQNIVAILLFTYGILLVLGWI